MRKLNAPPSGRYTFRVPVKGFYFSHYLAGTRILRSTGPTKNFSLGEHLTRAFLGENFKIMSTICFHMDVQQYLKVVLFSVLFPCFCH